MEPFTVNTVELILLSTAGVLLLIQAIYYGGLYNRIHARCKATTREEVQFVQEYPPLSVIISAQNESENLRAYLPSILQQDYPAFEVIVINDGSTDETEELLASLEELYPNLYHSFTPDSARYISRKKLSLTLGIKASKHDWLVFTQANCCPVSNQWLRLLARNFTPHTQIVLGYSGYKAGKGWLYKQVAFDNLFTSLRYLGWALVGRPYMGIGRNMAYRKALFFAHKGYSTHLGLQRGEDDLLINQLATRHNTRVETHIQATIKMQPIPSYKEWKEEKVSYMATSRHFKGIQRGVLGLETTSRLLFYAATVGAVVMGILSAHWLVVGMAGLAWVLRYIMQAVVINKTAMDVGDTSRYYLTLPVWDLLQPAQSILFKIYRRYRGKGDIRRR